MIAQLPFHIEKERRGKNLASMQLFARWPSSPSLRKKQGRKTRLLNSVQWVLAYLFFEPVLFSYDSISFNRLAPDLHQHPEKELALGKQTRQRLNRLWSALNSAGFAPAVDGYKGTGPVLGWICRDLPLNTKEGSPQPRWLEGMQRALAHANKGDFIPFSEAEHKSILFCRSLGLPHFFPWGTSSIHVLTGKDAAGERGWLCPLFSPQYPAQWKLDFTLPGN